MSFKAVFIAALALLLAGGAVVYYYAGQEPGPLVKIEKPAAIGGGAVAVDVAVDSLGTKLRRLDVSVEQQGRVFRLFSLDAPGEARFAQETADRIRITQESPPSALTGLRDGPARLVVAASRDVLYGIRRADTAETRDLAVRLTPPKLTVVSMHHYVNLGGAEMVVYRVSPADAMSGVRAGSRYYPGFPATGAAGTRAAGAPPIDPALRVAFFGLLHDQDITTPIRLVARDPAGNTATAEFAYRAFTAEFTRRRLLVDDAFFQKVVPPILEATPSLQLRAGTPEERLEAFLKINGDLRRANEAQIEDLARGTSSEMLWRGTFTRMGRAKAEAVFADHRTASMAIARSISRCTRDRPGVHARAAITAANIGHVARRLPASRQPRRSITARSRSTRTCRADCRGGDRTNRGETIAQRRHRLAGGDHLHFTMLVAGRPVNPIERTRTGSLTASTASSSRRASAAVGRHESPGGGPRRGGRRWQEISCE
jgi:hypothetical protein